MDRMIAVAPLQRDWDRRGSAAVRADALSFAWNILSQAMPSEAKAPVVIPLGHGGVQLEWSNRRGAELEIEVVRPFEVFVNFTAGPGDDDHILPVSFSRLEELAQLLRRHFSQ